MYALNDVGIMLEKISYIVDYVALYACVCACVRAYVSACVRVYNGLEHAYLKVPEV